MTMLGLPDKDGQGPVQDRSPEDGVTLKMVFGAIIVILAIFGYLYFFTDLIRSHGEPQVVAEVPVRKPLPRKSVSMAAMSTSVARHEPVTPKTEVGTPQRSPEGPAQPAVTATHVTNQPKAKTATTSAAPLSNAIPTASPKPRQKLPPTPSPVKPAAETAPKPEPSVKSAKGVVYVIQCGPFTSYREQMPARTALQKAGLKPAATPGPKTPTLMYRLFVATYGDAASLSNERKKLLEMTPDVFVIPHDGAYDLYAGSYHESSRAVSAQNRLTALGIKVELKQVTVPVATKQVVAGEFTSREAADKVAERLRKNAIPCCVIQWRPAVSRGRSAPGESDAGLYQAPDPGKPHLIVAGDFATKESAAAAADQLKKKGIPCSIVKWSR